jgi:hypothetical protein
VRCQARPASRQRGLPLAIAFALCTSSSALQSASDSDVVGTWKLDIAKFMTESKSMFEGPGPQQDPVGEHEFRTKIERINVVFRSDHTAVLSSGKQHDSGRWTREGSKVIFVKSSRAGSWREVFQLDHGQLSSRLFDGRLSWTRTSKPRTGR